MRWQSAVAELLKNFNLRDSAIFSSSQILADALEARYGALGFIYYACVFTYFLKIQPLMCYTYTFKVCAFIYNLNVN